MNLHVNLVKSKHALDAVQNVFNVFLLTLVDKAYIPSWT